MRGGPCLPLLIRGGVTPFTPLYIDMSCHHPRHNFWTGRYTKNGKKEFINVDGSVYLLPVRDVYRRFKGEGVLPLPHTVCINGVDYLDQYDDCPCGSCLGCRFDRAKEWAARCYLESLYYSREEVYFFTLSYDPRHVPKDGSLCKRDLQLFWKRLRKAGYLFRYFACGEYGETTRRPHYHAIMFGLKLDDLVYYGKSPQLSDLYVSRSLDSIWSCGRVWIGNADPASMAYVAGYCTKKLKEHDLPDSMEPPFLIMSRKPAIGTRYFMENQDPIMISNKVYGSFNSSHHASVPRHFLNKLSDIDPCWAFGRKVAREGLAQKAKDSDIVLTGIVDDMERGFFHQSVLMQKLDKTKRS